MACLVLTSRADPVLTALQKYTINGKVPILCMTFDDAGFKDSSPKGNDGTPAGGVAATTGLSSGAMNFDGDDDYINVSDNDELDCVGDCTILTWIKLNKTGTVGILDKKASAYGQATGWELEYGSSANRFLFMGSGSTFATATINLNIDTWRQVGAVITGGTVQFYVDGVALSMNDSTITAVKAGTDPLVIGVRQNTADSNFKGTIDEALIYNKSLSASEVKILYNIGKAGVR